MSIPVTLVPGTLPFDCYPSPQELNVAIITLARAFLPVEFTGIYRSPTAPPADQRDKAWLHPNGRIYQWNDTYGDWMREYDEPANSPRLMPWEGSLADLDSYAGGSSGAVGPAMGPLWARATEYDGRVVVGAGTIPGTDPAVTIAQGATQDSDNLSGERKHVLTEAEGAVGAHIHPFGHWSSDDDAWHATQSSQTVPSFSARLCQGIGNEVVTDSYTQSEMFTLKAANGAGVTSEGHNNMMPFKGIYWARRTSRIYVLAPY